MSAALRIEFVAWHSEHPLELQEIEARLDAVEGFYPHAQFRRCTKIGANGYTGLVTWLPKHGSLAELTGYAGDALAFASHFPFGITQHVAVEGDCAPSSILALHEKVVRAPEVMSALAAPLCLVHLSASGCLHLNNDFRGLAEIFYHSGKSIHVWSNRLAMPLVFALEEPQESQVGGQVRAVLSYFPRTHSPFSNIQRVDGGTSVFGGDWPAKPLISRRRLLLDMLSEASESEGTPIDYARCAQHVSQTIGEIKKFWSGPISSGLTGGRDSRAVLAFLIAAGIADRVAFATTKIHKNDYEPASTLVDICRKQGQDVTWDLEAGLDSSYRSTNEDNAWQDFPAGRYGNSGPWASIRSLTNWATIDNRIDRSEIYKYQINPLLDRMVFQFHRLDGQTMPLGYYTTPEALSLDHSRNLLLGGQSGEVLRASGYGLQNLEISPDDWINRVSCGQFRLGRLERSMPYALEARKRAQAEWMQYIEEARGAGLSGFKLLDYLNVAGKQSRRIDVSKFLLLACPLAHPALLAESYKLTPKSRSSNAFHIGLIEALAPYLLEVPFSFQLPKDESSLRMDLKDLPQFWEANSVPGFSQIIKENWRWSDTFDRGLMEAEFGENAEPVLSSYHRDAYAGYLLWRSAQGAYVRILSRYITSKRRTISNIMSKRIAL